MGRGEVMNRSSSDRVRGGQGRTGREVRAMVVSLIWLVLAVLILGGLAAIIGIE